MDAGAAKARASTLDPRRVRAFLTENPGFLTGDDALLAELGLRPAASNIVDFGPAALARANTARQQESSARLQLEVTVRENFAAQAQTHGAVIDILEARNHADLARRVHDLAQLRFGLTAGVLALEQPGRAPAGWQTLGVGEIDKILGGPQRFAAMGQVPAALSLFGGFSGQVGSLALVRLALWQPGRQGLLVLGSDDPAGFTSDMGTELVSFLARVIERTAERWPVL